MDRGESGKNNVASNGQPHPTARGLPPVEPPSARFILQLFLVPGLLVALVVGFIWLFFGWLGSGPEQPKEFIEGLRSTNEHRRWRIAQDLAQVLPRKKELRGDVSFALAITEELDAGLRADPPSEAGEKADLMEFLPAAAGTFHVPVAAPVLVDMIDRYKDEIQQREPMQGEDPRQVYVNAKGLRLRNAVVALGLLGARLTEYDQLSDGEKEKIRSDLQGEISGGERRRRWAELTLRYLDDRERRKNTPDAAEDVFGIVPALEQAAFSKDELTRKYAVLALANWSEPGIEQVLARMSNVSGVEIFASNESGYPDRAGYEIRFNAVLVLARRNSPATDWDTVLQTLDPVFLQQTVYRDEKSQPASDVLIQKALRDLREWSKHYGSAETAFETQPRIKQAVVKLTVHPNAAVQVEARRLLGQETGLAGITGSLSRQMLLIIGLAGAIGVLLLLAVASRWRRKPPSVASLETAA